MHGIVFSELKRYVDEKVGGGAWENLLETAGIPSKLYIVTESYADKEAADIVAAASSATGKAPSAILQDFGEFIVPTLLKVYGSFLKPEWRTLDLIENTEETIHRVVRMRSPGAAPPEIKCRRAGPRGVVITYSSKRKMCDLAKGIVTGIAGHYHERVAISESSCMLKGAPVCSILVTQAG